jgi:hypothetical protein
MSITFIIGLIVVVVIFAFVMAKATKRDDEKRTIAQPTLPSARVYTDEEVDFLKSVGKHVGPGIERNAFRYLQQYHAPRMAPGYRISGPFQRDNQDVFQIVNAF